MIKSYIVIAFRSLRRNLSYAFLNVFGLTLGIAACLVIFLVVRNELNYDNYAKADRIYRVTLNAIDFNSNVSLAVAPRMRNDFPELEAVTQIMYNKQVMVKVDDKRFIDNDFVFADQYLTKVFNLGWLAGDANTALSEPNSIVITKTLAKKYFGDKNPMGRIINVENQINAKVTGVIKDQPGNRSVPIQMLLSLETIKDKIQPNSASFWNIGGGFFTFVLLPPNYSIWKIQKGIPQFLQKNWNKDVGATVRLPLQPIRDIHFDQRYINNIVTPTSRDTYYALFGVALLIIITACINFINLATAQAIKRSKEVGVRKVLGAARSQLIKQFMGETTVLVLVALILGVFLAALFLKQTASWLNVTIDAAQLKQPLVMAWIAVVTLLVILLSGLYPAFVLSAFQPVNSLKNSVAHSAGRFTLRKGLVIAQFAISQILIVGTLIVARQMDFFENQDLGFNKDAIVSIEINNMAKGNILKQQLASNPGVKNMTFSSGAPSYNNNFTSFSAPAFGIVKDDVSEMKYVDENYIDMFQLKMLAGSKLIKTDPGDTAQNVVVNETLIHKLGIMKPDNALGKNIILNGRYATIIGVIQDFQSESKQKKRRACAMEYKADNFFMASLKLSTVGMNQTIQRIEKSWSALFPDRVFQYQFLDEHIAGFYKQEQMVYTAFRLFSGIAILIGCLGLYGLITFAASQRTKEVGIRKVLGAPVLSIVGLFSKEFLLLITVAFAIAAPIGYYAMHNWLQNYAYHISIGAGTFMVAIAASIIIAAVTISYQAIKAALVNPVNSLRSE
ncbi:MAG TPA: ABC transporter permease [Mucilaginibacter sp.]|nr:ABC transporter permease [Mucilaginibacter sp.]